MGSDAAAHVAHRERLRARYRREGLDGFEPHEVLEMLLFYAIPRRDTNPIAHALLRRFGNLAAVMDAPVEELMQVQGIGENAACLIKLMPDLYRRYLVSKETDTVYVAGTRDAAAHVVSRLEGRRNECVVLLLLDSRHRVLYCDVVNEGTCVTANIYVRKLVQKAVQYDAVFAYLAHNHPSGEVLPSEQDLYATQLVYQALQSVNVELCDHIVVGGGDYISLREGGYLQLAMDIQRQPPQRMVADNLEPGAGQGPDEED